MIRKDVPFLFEDRLSVTLRTEV